jgi:hypothetical protein
VLFSRPDVSNYINHNFEATWESVRPVPLVHIDFGNGTKLTRTLHGNIATYCCAPDGQVLDVVAGIYDPAGYWARLQQLRLLANYVDQEGVEKRGARLREYHNGVVDALRQDKTLPQFIDLAGMYKARIETGVKALLVKGGQPKGKEEATVATTEVKGDDAATFRYLLEDTKANEQIRRRQVSELLLAAGATTPARITKKVYRDILLADIDDPYLGLGKTLFADYPFKDEDRKTP